MQHQPQFAFVNGHDRCAGSSREEIARSHVCASRELLFVLKALDGRAGATGECSDPKGFGASGPSIACSLGYHDANETSCHKLVDSGNGFRNFGNARLLARKPRHSSSMDRSGVTPRRAAANPDRHRRSLRSPFENGWISRVHLTFIIGRQRPASLASSSAARSGGPQSAATEQSLR